MLGKAINPLIPSGSDLMVLLTAESCHWFVAHCGLKPTACPSLSHRGGSTQSRWSARHLFWCLVVTGRGFYF